MHEITGDTLTVARSDTWLRRSVTWLRTRVEKHSILKLGFPTWPTLGAVFSSYVPWRKKMSNGQISPLHNAATNGLLGSSGAANNLSSQQMQMALQQMQYNNAIMNANPPVMLREEVRARRRLYVSVEAVANGFVLEAGAERLIAKDIEELQQHFVAQVASLLLEKEK